MIYKKVLIFSQYNIFTADRFVLKHWLYSFPKKKKFVVSIIVFIKVFTIHKYFVSQTKIST